ncbi:MAG: hypothetical protein HYY25_09930 [Candidatus Wallbacteria bacterium]|nr:hypothetical protein [Candidatus Wallbacteria bacterium]
MGDTSSKFKGTAIGVAGGVAILLKTLGSEGAAIGKVGSLAAREAAAVGSVSRGAAAGGRVAGEAAVAGRAASELGQAASVADDVARVGSAASHEADAARALDAGLDVGGSLRRGARAELPVPHGSTVHSVPVAADVEASGGWTKALGHVGDAGNVADVVGSASDFFGEEAGESEEAAPRASRPSAQGPGQVARLAGAAEPVILCRVDAAGPDSNITLAAAGLPPAKLVLSGQEAANADTVAWRLRRQLTTRFPAVAHRLSMYRKVLLRASDPRPQLAVFFNGKELLRLDTPEGRLALRALDGP